MKLAIYTNELDIELEALAKLWQFENSLPILAVFLHPFFFYSKRPNALFIFFSPSMYNTCVFHGNGTCSELTRTDTTIIIK